MDSFINIKVPNLEDHSLQVRESKALRSTFLDVVVNLENSILDWEYILSPETDSLTYSEVLTAWNINTLEMVIKKYQYMQLFYALLSIFLIIMF